jgi:hypothetical protein
MMTTNRFPTTEATGTDEDRVFPDLNYRNEHTYD